MEKATQSQDLVWQKMEGHIAFRKQSFLLVTFLKPQIPFEII